MVTGDFNLLDVTWSETGGRLISNPTYGSVLNSTFLNILDDFSLEQLVLSPTRGNHILDLILTSQPGLFTDGTIVPGMSDHKAVCVCVRVCTCMRACVSLCMCKCVHAHGCVIMCLSVIL